MHNKYFNVTQAYSLGHNSASKWSYIQDVTFLSATNTRQESLVNIKQYFSNIQRAENPQCDRIPHF